jgi:hypothetical protein
VAAYWHAIDEGSYPAAYEMLSSSYKAQLTLEQFTAQTSAAISHATGVQFSDASQLPDGTIRLAVQVNIEPGSQPGNYSSGANVRFFTLVQENGGWRISNIATSP